MDSPDYFGIFAAVLFCLLVIWLFVKAFVEKSKKDRAREKFFKERREMDRLLEEDEVARRQVQARQEMRGQELFEANKDLIEKFFEIAERKVSIIDDYGDENWDALSKEIEVCRIKIYKRNGEDSGGWKDAWVSAKLDEAFREYHQAQKEKPSNGTEFKNLSRRDGRDFETLISKNLQENGFDVRGTPATGDQGADLIAKKDGRTIIIQAKRYQGAVGNKAVQEVIGAVHFYGGDEGWVITTSTFTPSAKALAQRSNIRLIDGRMLEMAPTVWTAG